jgi:CubicO group peptidase (beta-lactamase class C family)
VLIHETMVRQRLASMSVAVARDGKVVFEESFGWADVERRVRATPNTIYRLASVSKILTATGLMVLVERGLVDLDRPVNDYLGPAQLVSHADPASTPTVRQVLLHTSGLPIHFNLFFGGSPHRPPDMDESIRRYGILTGVPGEEYQYSNFGYAVLGRVIEQVSGRTYEDFMRAEVFEPLGMSHTSVMVDPAYRDSAARLYDRQGRQIPGWDCDHRPASLICSNARDLLLFGMFLLGNRPPGQPSILSTQALKALHRPSEVRHPDPGADFPDSARYGVWVGLGCSVVELCGHRFVEHSGGAPGVRARLGLVPDEGIAVVLLSNSGSFDGMDIWELEWGAFASLIPGLPWNLEVLPQAPARGSFPDSLLGGWVGVLRTHADTVSARLTIRHRGHVDLALAGVVHRPIEVPTPLGRLDFRDGVFSGPFFGRIDTEDTRRASQVLHARLRLRGDRLYGALAAVARDRQFWLPSYMELRRVRHERGP